jgi:hypothetical protein
MQDDYTRKPLPPYGKHLKKTRGDTVFVLAGSGFSRGKPKAGHCLALPDGADPFEFTWPVKDCVVIVLDDLPLSEHDAQVLGLALRQAGAECSIWHDNRRQRTSFLVEGMAGQ